MKHRPQIGFRLCCANILLPILVALQRRNSFKDTLSFIMSTQGMESYSQGTCSGVYHVICLVPKTAPDSKGSPSRIQSFFVSSHFVEQFPIPPQYLSIMCGLIF